MDINIEELKKICTDFFKLAGMEFSLWDENKNNIFSFPAIHSEFCKNVRKNRTLYLNCLKCDKNGLDEVNTTKEPHQYCCHMGLTEAILPILQEDEIVGYLMLGQIAEEENLEKIHNSINTIPESFEFKEELRNSLKKTTICSHDKIVYCMNTLKVLIEYMNLSYVIQKSSDTIFYRVKRFILANIEKPIMPRDICKNIGISSNMLFKTVKNSTCKNPTEYIRHLKIEEAKQKLQKTTYSISLIAESVGYNDTNYFIRIFRKEVGIPPLKYRKSFSNSDFL
ncbi:MAG: PocR ligand-binding domain-containing protein [Clostridia bacterium]|nr:PocR ligand-binding domain-containing protein [Clostridia bacterium]